MKGHDEKHPLDDTIPHKPHKTYDNLHRQGHGRRYDDMKVNGERYLFGGLQVVVILMLAWGGTNVIDNGKALARVETKLSSYSILTDKLYDRVLSLEKEGR